MFRIAAHAVVAVMLLTMAACRPAPEQAPAAAPDAPSGAEPATAATPATGTDAIAVVHHDRPDPAGFDRKAFAGRFTGTLPCADCPGIDTRLDIAADGSFALHEVDQGRDVASDITGTWTLDGDDGSRLLLDPDSKDAPDRRFEIISKDALRALDSNGNPIESAQGHGLRRG